jgi:hypothetical protein
VDYLFARQKLPTWSLVNGYQSNNRATQRSVSRSFKNIQHNGESRFLRKSWAIWQMEISSLRYLLLAFMCPREKKLRSTWILYSIRIQQSWSWGFIVIRWQALDNVLNHEHAILMECHAIHGLRSTVWWKNHWWTWQRALQGLRSNLGYWFLLLTQLLLQLISYRVQLSYSRRQWASEIHWVHPENARKRYSSYLRSSSKCRSYIQT